MNDLGRISMQLWELLRCGAVPDELAAGGALRCALDDRRGIQLRFQASPPRWLLGVEQIVDTLDEHGQARCHEALLRAAHASRWTALQVGTLDEQARIGLMDCDFPGTLQQAAALAHAGLIEGRLAALLLQLERLASPAAATPAPPDSADWLKA